MDEMNNHPPGLLSPIAETFEVTEEESAELAIDLTDDSIKRQAIGKLDLETSVENVEERLLQPETPPDVLRGRLRSLETDYEQLKEFTDLEKQMYHADCVPKEKVKSLEEDFALLNVKVGHLMRENYDYRKKLETEEDENTNLKLELEHLKSLHDNSIDLLKNMLMKLQKNSKVFKIPPLNPEVFLATLPTGENQTFSLLEKCGKNFESPHIQDVRNFFNSLRDLDKLLDISSQEKRELQDIIEHLQSEVFTLNEKVEKMSQEVVVYREKLSIVSYESLGFQEKLANIEKELTEMSEALLVYENELSEHSKNNDNNTKINRLQGYINTTQQNINSIISHLESFISSLYDDSDFKNSFVTQEEFTEIEQNFVENRNLIGISNIFTILSEIFHKVKREVKFKNEECLELKVNIEQLNDCLRRYEESGKEQKDKIEYLVKEVNQHIPSRLLQLEDCFISKNNEILALKNSLEEANSKVDVLSYGLLESTLKIDQMSASLKKSFLEKTGLENEILKLKDCWNIDSLQKQFVSMLKCLENTLDSWNEKSNLENLINMFPKNTNISCITSTLLNDNTKDILNEVAMKCKGKLLLHDAETNNLCSRLKLLNNDIDRLEIENKEIKLEVKTLDTILKEGICERVSNLEGLLCRSDQEKPEYENEKQKSCEEKCDSLVIPDLLKNDLNPIISTQISCEKLQKQINNFNKAIKPDDVIEKTLINLNEIENLIDSWDSSGELQVEEFTLLLCDNLSKYYDNDQNSKIKMDILRMFNKFEAKLMESGQWNNQFLETSKPCCNCENREKQKDLFTCAIEDLQLKSNDSNAVDALNNCEKEQKQNITEEIKTIKKLMCLEITSMDANEDEESLMSESLKHIFSKLMQTIILKEQEMSHSIKKQHKEDVYNFEQTIEKLNNKLKSQESWISALESENDKVSTELSALKIINYSLDQKVKSLLNELNNKTLEIDFEKRKVLDLMTENQSLISDLDSAKDLLNKCKFSNSSLEKEIEKLNEDIINKANTIEVLKSKLDSFFEQQVNRISELSISSIDSSSQNAKRDSIMIGGTQTQESKFSSANNDQIKDNIGDHIEENFDSDIALSKIIEKEIAFINTMLEKGGLRELFFNCNESLDVLKDVIQNIGSKISGLEINHIKDFQSIQSALEYKTKEMSDFKLSLSKLYWDLPLQLRKGEMITSESDHQFSYSSVQNEVDQIRSEFASISNTVYEFEESAKTGQNIVHDLKEAIQTVLNESNKNAQCVLHLQKEIACHQETIDEYKSRNENITKENDLLISRNSILENEIGVLQSKLSKIEEKVFSKLDIDFPGEIENDEKVAFVNKTLKQYADTQNACYAVTEELRFFGYHCELMLSYIQSLEYKLCFTIHQKEHIEKEYNLLKAQLTTQHLEMNRFFNQLVSKSPFPIQSQNQVLEVLNHIFTEYKSLRENNAKVLNEGRIKKEKVFLLQNEVTSLTKQNSSLKFELTKCEDSIRNLRSELRNVRSKCQRRASISLDSTEVKTNKTDATVQTDTGVCCKRLKKMIAEQKEKIDNLTAKLNKIDQGQRMSVTSDPYKKQVSYLEGALDQAKERIGRLTFALKQQESHNQELVDALKRHESCQHRLDEARMELENLRKNK